MLNVLCKLLISPAKWQMANGAACDMINEMLACNCGQHTHTHTLTRNTQHGTHRAERMVSGVWWYKLGQINCNSLRCVKISLVIRWWKHCELRAASSELRTVSRKVSLHNVGQCVRRISRGEAGRTVGEGLGWMIYLGNSTMLLLKCWGGAR